jgi:hypothetical protein
MELNRPRAELVDDYDDDDGWGHENKSFSLRLLFLDDFNDFLNVPLHLDLKLETFCLPKPFSIPSKSQFVSSFEVDSLKESRQSEINQSRDIAPSWNSQTSTGSR